MNCNTTDLARRNGTRCRSFDCQPCAKFFRKVSTKPKQFVEDIISIASNVNTEGDETVFALTNAGNIYHGGWGDEETGFVWADEPLPPLPQMQNDSLSSEVHEEESGQIYIPQPNCRFKDCPEEQTPQTIFCKDHTKASTLVKI